MRSISSHWKRDFDEQEADLDSELSKEGGATSPLDSAVSKAPSPELEVMARQQWNLIAVRCQHDTDAMQVLEGFARGLTPSEIMHASKLSRWRYQEAMRRIRLRLRDIDQFKERSREQ